MQSLINVLEKQRKGEREKAALLIQDNKIKIEKKVVK